MATRINWNEVARMLGGRELHTLGDRGAIISVGFEESKVIGCTELWLTDNGGEINIDGVNHKIDLPSINVSHPVTPFEGPDAIDGWTYVGPWTIADRLWKKFTGQNIDYTDMID